MPSTGTGRSQDSGDKPGPEKGEAYGMGAVTQILKGTSFPARKDELAKKAGSQSISWTKGGDKLRLADLINQAPGDEFPNMRNVISSVATAARGEASKDKGKSGGR
ncbi:MAG: hypothetical protein ACYC4L_01980 [Chloroflexota bacterium]